MGRSAGLTSTSRVGSPTRFRSGRSFPLGVNRALEHAFEAVIPVSTPAAAMPRIHACLRCLPSVLLPLCLLGGTIDAQVVNPADKAKGEAPSIEEDHEAWKRMRSWELPAQTLVIGERQGRYFEEDRVGSYGQPRWTAKRLFPSTRVYVVPEGKVEFEHWTRVKVPRDGGASTVETQYELEFGLPHRFQIDLYYVTEREGSEGELDLSEQKYELRYALADWGEIPLNPTLYAEYIVRSGKSDKIEGKLLLGDELAPGWHWGSNLVFERELGDALENVYELTMGLSRTIVDSKLALGAEMKAALVDDHFDRGDHAQELEIGPSLRWQPLPAFHIDFAPLIGIGGDSRAADIYLVAGWEF